MIYSGATYFNNKNFYNAITNLDEGVTSISDITDFDWDYMYIFSPYTTKSVMEDEIGFSSKKLSDNNVERFNFVFVSGSEVVSTGLYYLDFNLPSVISASDDTFIYSNSSFSLYIDFLGSYNNSNGDVLTVSISEDFEILFNSNVTDVILNDEGMFVHLNQVIEDTDQGEHHTFYTIIYAGIDFSYGAASVNEVLTSSSVDRLVFFDSFASDVYSKDVFYKIY